jgi:hypothetical protein
MKIRLVLCALLGALGLPVSAQDREFVPPEQAVRLADAQGAPVEPGQHRRGPWYVGFGLGVGDGQVSVGGQERSFNALLGRGGTSTAFNLRVGATLTPRLLLGFDGGAVAASASGPTERVQLNVYDVGVMFFPWRDGAFLRGAAGASNVLVTSDGPVLSGTGTLWGGNALVGLGYAWWVGETFNLTFGADYRRLWRFRGGVEGVGTAGGWSACLGFDWY